LGYLKIIYGDRWLIVRSNDQALLRFAPQRFPPPIVQDRFMSVTVPFVDKGIKLSYITSRIK